MENTTVPTLKTIGDYLNLESDRKFVVPEYQRAYSWDKEKCEKLFEDIESRKDGNCYYFFGTIIADYSNPGEINLIDGQQRTISFLILLKALLLKILAAQKSLPENEISQSLRDSLDDKVNSILKILYNVEPKEKHSFLKTWKLKDGFSIFETKSINELPEYKDEFQKILNAKEYEELENSAEKSSKKQRNCSRFFSNFKLFYDNLGENYTDSIKLDEFTEIFLKKCQVIEIRSDDSEQAIEMFNSLNSDGQPLSDADIISAKLYSNAEKNKEKEAFDEVWKRFLELTSELEKKEIVKIDSVLQQNMYINRAKNGEAGLTIQSLRNYYTVRHKDCNPELLDNPVKLCEQLEKLASIWDSIQDIPIIKLLLRFNDNEKLFLISYLDRFELDSVKNEVFDISECLLRLFAILELVESPYSSKNFKSFLFKENIKLVDRNYPIEQIKNDFNKHIHNNFEKDNIKSLLFTYDKNVLVYLKEYLYAKEKGKEFVLDSKVNVEHIAPASGKNIGVIRKDVMGFDDKEGFNNIVNTLGNKILLEEKINKSLSNEWFRTKKQTSVKDKSGYKDSKFPIAFDLAKYKKDVWEKEDIENATKKATARILKFIFGEANS